MIGFGTEICGGSAIAAASPILEAEEEDIALSISTIFFFNILAVFIFPFLGHLMQMSDGYFGTWAGTAINDTSSVVAAGYTYSQAAGDLATIVKLSRALMIVPACLIFAGYRYVSSKSGLEENFSLVHSVVCYGFCCEQLGNFSIKSSSLHKAVIPMADGYGLSRDWSQGFIQTVQGSWSGTIINRSFCLVLRRSF